MLDEREAKTTVGMFMQSGWHVKTAAGDRMASVKAAAYLPLSSSFVVSAFVHVLVFFLTSALISSRGNMLQKELIPVTLFDISQGEQEAQSPKEEPPRPSHKPPAFRPKSETFNKPLPTAKPEALQLERPDPPPAPAKEDAKLTEGKPILPTQREQEPIFPSAATTEGGGSESGGDLFGTGDVSLAPGSEIPGEGGGTATTGPSGGSGPPQPTLRTNREAKPLQTVRAFYPAMALRTGLEGDVALRIEIDTDGKVTKADIIKSAGAAFDEEALKAVKQSRFEPARKDGLNVPAEFTYIYRFRLAK
jgi:periplasmic protein TonB